MSAWSVQARAEVPAVDLVTLVALTVFGAMLGSFLNVLIHRVPPRAEQRAVGRRSACPHCGQAIPAWLNIPILAWLALRGRARCCGARISPRYPLVEALAAAGAWLLVSHPPTGVPPSLVEPTLVGWAGFVLGMWLLGTLIAGTFIDLEFRLLPDKLTRPLLVVGLLGALVVPEFAGPLDGLRRLPPLTRGLLAAGAGALAGGGVTWLVRIVGGWWFRQDALGLGDVKLMFGIGAFLGWRGALLTFFLGCLLGAVIGSLGRILVRDPYLAFGPYLAAGAVLILFLEDALLAFLTETWPRWLAEHPAAAQWIAGGLGLLALVTLFHLYTARRRRAGGG